MPAHPRPAGRPGRRRAAPRAARAARRARRAHRASRGTRWPARRACAGSSTARPPASTATAAARWVDETRALRPATDRARRRVDAEAATAPASAGSTASRVTMLRMPGIYALDRAGGDPRERLARGTPVLAAADDVFTSHIHADDLARACVAALHRGRRSAWSTSPTTAVAEDGRLLRSRRRSLRHGAAAAPRPRRCDGARCRRCR